MSVLESPRLYFKGKCTWDPIVTNNSTNYWDIATSKPDQPLNSAAAYRAEVDNQIDSHKNWNPQGTHRSVFYETEANGFDSGSGTSTNDPVINVPVSLSAMLVDVDPYVSNTSQLFFDELTVGIDGGPQIKMPNNGPMVGRYINFARNRNEGLEIAGIASVIWQGSCLEGLQINPSDSEFLKLLKSKVDSGEADGLTVRINAYRTIYFDGPAPKQGTTDLRYKELEDRVKGGGFQPNPARSLIVGVIGLHRDGEPLSTPGDRQLSGALGTAFSRIEETRLIIDLGNSVPEKNFEADKQDLGDLTITAGKEVIGTLTPGDYNKTAYDASAGLVTLHLNPAQVEAAGSAALSIANASRPLLTEQALTAVINPPNLYVEGVDSKEIELQVLQHGQPISKKTKVQVAEVARDPASTPPSPPLQVRTVETGDDGRIKLTFDSALNTTDFAVFNGSSQWVFTPFTSAAPPAPAQVNTSTDCYLAIRVTPADDDIAAMSPTWENVHQHVLINWEALAPCMDNWLKLGDEAQCRSLAPLLKKLTSLDYFDNFRYMPVTRGMTKGQRTLLHNWCDSPAPGGAETAASVSAIKAKVKDTGQCPVNLSRGFSDDRET